MCWGNVLLAFILFWFISPFSVQAMDFSTPECERFLSEETETILRNWQTHPNLNHLTFEGAKGLVPKITQREWAFLHHERDWRYLSSLVEALSAARDDQAEYSHEVDYDSKKARQMNFAADFTALMNLGQGGWNQPQLDSRLLPDGAPEVPLYYYFGTPYPLFDLLDGASHVLRYQLLIGRMLVDFYDQLVKDHDLKKAGRPATLEEREAVYQKVIDAQAEKFNKLKLENFYHLIAPHEQETLLDASEMIGQQERVPWMHRRFLRDIVAFYRSNELLPIVGLLVYLELLKAYLVEHHGLEIVN